LPPPLFVVGRDALNLPRTDIFDAIKLARDVAAPQGVPAHMAFIWRLAVMRGSADRADGGTEGW